MISLLGDPAPMLEVIDQGLAAQGLPVDLICDHICYRVASEARYQELKQALGEYGTLESEVLISGRLISVFALHEPYVYQGREITALELPAPKAGADYAEGWEHAEFITGEPLASFIAKHSAVAFNTKAMAKAHNPEIGLKITPQYQAKFHQAHILDVIAAERVNPALLMA